ncbi:MAG TPA: (Fe-S)-binding protein [Thermodesulfobacteriota bacterium]|nr:(Fe-S)-binding protein [Thermodesulfobacteriota bacterium]
MKVDPKTLAQDFHLNLCIQCGTCTGGCPVKFRSPLNMRRLVRETYLNADLPQILKRPELWACTTCSTCSLRCPAGVKNVEMIMGIRDILTRQGDVPSTIRDALENTFLHGNPWGRFKDRRADWAKDLGVKIIGEEKTETLFYIGCTPSYDPRAQNISKALVKVFQKVGLDFGILGKKEICCGNEIRRMGEQTLFKKLAKDNLALFQKSGLKKIITISPHCYNAFKNDYPENSFEVLHYTQLLADWIGSGKLKLEKKLEIRATYQDPCFLGKQNKIFEEPRKILSAIPGLNYVEMDRSRERSLCCEGGGGRMWAEGGTTGSRNAEIRIQEALGLGASVISTSCPFCLLTLEDAAKISGRGDQIMVKDISELVAEAMDDPNSNNQIPSSK